VAVTLAQGGAQHYLDGTTGVKDLDVWTFYAAIADMPLRCGRYEVHADFGLSVHGRQEYPPGFKHRQAARWLAYEGRRVDFMVRDLQVDAEAAADEVTEALRSWLTASASATGAKKSPSVVLSRKAMIWLVPAEPGTVIWPVGSVPEPADQLKDRLPQ
jgi:hypothetical protein